MEIPPQRSAESTIRRDRRGLWTHDGEPVTNPAVARAFDRWIDRAEDGRYVLQNERSWCYVEIEGPPIWVERLDVRADSLWLSLSDGTEEALAEETLHLGGEGALACRVRGGRLEAELTRVAQLQLLPLLEEDAAGLYLALPARQVRLPAG